MATYSKSQFSNFSSRADHIFLRLHGKSKEYILLYVKVPSIDLAPST